MSVFKKIMVLKFDETDGKLEGNQHKKHLYKLN